MLELAVPVTLAAVLVIGCATFRMADTVLDVTIVLLFTALALLTGAACIQYGDGVVSILSHDPPVGHPARTVERRWVDPDPTR